MGLEAQWGSSPFPTPPWGPGVSVVATRAGPTLLEAPLLPLESFRRAPEGARAQLAAQTRGGENGTLHMPKDMPNHFPFPNFCHGNGSLGW